ncbi:MFS transporter, partial [Acinetobacter baumannii]
MLTTPQTRGRAMALVFLGFTASTVLGVPIGTVAGDLLGWRATFWAIVSLACLALFAVRLLLPHDLRAPAIDTRSWFTVFSN